MTEACFPGPLCSVGAEVLGPAHVRMCVCCRCTHSCYYYHTQIVLTPPEAGQVPATRRSEATPRPRAGCPPASAAGLIMTPKRDARGQHELSARAFCPRAVCQPGCSTWHRQLARRRSQARLLGWLVPAVHGRSHLRGLLWPSRASRSKRVRLAGRPTHLPSTRSVRGGSSNARLMKWKDWRLPSPRPRQWSVRYRTARLCWRAPAYAS